MYMNGILTMETSTYPMWTGKEEELAQRTMTSLEALYIRSLDRWKMHECSSQFQLF